MAQRKQFRSRHNPDYVIDKKLDTTSDGLVELLAFFDGSDRYDVLPRNWICAFFDRHPEYLRHFLGELTCRRTKGPDQLLGRYTIGDDESLTQMMKYYRTDAGDDFMASIGKPKLPYHRPRELDLHQLFGNLRRASLELGVRTDPNFALEGPRSILSHPRMGEYDPRAPFTFFLPDGRRYTPDDKPLVLRRHEPRESKFLLFEDDRATMGTRKKRNFDDDTRRLHEKFEKIILVWKLRLVKKKYGHDAALLVFTTSGGGERALNIANYLHTTFGPLPYVLIKAMPEFSKLHKTIGPTTKVWDTPFIRPGCRPYSLKTLSEI